jgi:large subunit ribosomal protein L4
MARVINKGERVGQNAAAGIPWKIVSVENQEVGSLTLPSSLFGRKLKKEVVHFVLNGQQAGRRQGNASTKTRSDVRGGGKKPYKQKGTGRARRGTERSPICVGGGTVFGPHPRSYDYKLNKKQVKVALTMVLSDKVALGNLKVVDQLEMEKISTQAVGKILQNLSPKGSLLVDVGNENLSRSVRNLPRYRYIEPVGLNLYNLMKYEEVVVSKRALAVIEERLQ